MIHCFIQGNTIDKEKVVIQRIIVVHYLNLGLSFSLMLYAINKKYIYIYIYQIPSY